MYLFHMISLLTANKPQEASIYGNRQVCTCAVLSDRTQTQQLYRCN